MDKKFVIFDFDGTLVDSMWMWSSVGGEFLDKYGAKYNPQEILKATEKLTLPEAAKLFIDKFSLNMTISQVVDEMNNMVYNHYTSDICLKEGVYELLKYLEGNHTHMCIVSVTEEGIIKACLERLGILGFFDFILSCENTGLSKREPDIYVEAAKRFNAEASNVAVYEDMLHTIKTAKSAGFYTVGVFDNQPKEIWAEICELTDEIFKI